MKYPSLGSLRVEARLRESGKTALESIIPTCHSRLRRLYFAKPPDNTMCNQGEQDEDLESLHLPRSWSKTVRHAVLSEHPSVTSRTAKTNRWYAFASRVHCNSSQPLGVSDNAPATFARLFQAGFVRHMNHANAGHAAHRVRNRRSTSTATGDPIVLEIDCLGGPRHLPVISTPRAA